MRFTHNARGRGIGRPVIGGMAAWLVTGPLAAAAALTPADYLRQFDRDGDGRVSLAEYQEHLSAGFRAMDRNGDGVLSASELPPGTRSRTVLTLEGHRRSLARMFDQLDRDNDGFLGVRELTAPPF